MTKEQFINAIPRGLDTLQSLGSILEETAYRSPIKRLEGFTVADESFTLLEQNTKKQSRYAALAKEGYSVVWFIRESDGQMFLVVDGVWTNRDKVSQEGYVAANAAIG